MAWFQSAQSFADNTPFDTLKRLLEAAFFRDPEPQPVSAWRMIIDPPMPYSITLFCQACRIISLLILLPIFLIGILDFAGYAVFRTLGLHRRRVRIQRQTKAGVKVPIGRSSSRRRNPRVYRNDRNRPTDRSNIPSIVKAPLLSPGTYDAETLLRQRARSLSIGSAEEEAAWVASGGQQARLSTLNKDAADASLTSADSENGSLGDADTDGDAGRDYFGRAPRVGVDGAMGLADTDVDESGTESGLDSPVQRFSQLKGSRRRGLSGGLNFTPVSPYPPASPAAPSHHYEQTIADNDASNSASVVSLSSDSPTSSTNDDRPLTTGRKHVNKNDGDGSSSNMSSSWIGVEADAGQDVSPAPPLTVDPVQAAAAAGLEPDTQVA